MQVSSSGTSSSLDQSPNRSVKERAGAPIILIFIPFGAGYFLSYLFRTINGTISEELVSAFDLGPGSLGLLTAVYFLTFAAFQMPAGMLIDRYGPRRVQSGLLLIAAVGALLCAIAHHTATLMVGRALIGLGSSGALVTGVKALALWLAPSRRALGNCCLVMCGGLGAMASTIPLEAAAELLHWRLIFAALGIAVIAVAASVWLFVPEAPSAGGSGVRKMRQGLTLVMRDGRFWRVAPLSASVVGAAFAVHGLWAARWMADVAHMPQPAIAAALLVMGASLTVGAATLGVLATALRRVGVTTTGLFVCACLTFLVVEALIALYGTVLPIVLWGCFAVFGAITVLSFTMIGELFPPDLVGRANGLLNVMHLGTAFVMQSGIGAIVAFWPTKAGMGPPAVAYSAAMAGLIALQIVAMCWFSARTLPASLSRIGARVCQWPRLIALRSRQ